MGEVLSVALPGGGAAPLRGAVAVEGMGGRRYRCLIVMLEEGVYAELARLAEGRGHSPSVEAAYLIAERSFPLLCLTTTTGVVIGCPST